MEIKTLDEIVDLLTSDIYMLPNCRGIISEENQKEDGSLFSSYVKICCSPMSDNIDFRVYRFDDKRNNANHPILFPFFRHDTGYGLNKNCDYIVFAQKNSEFYVLLVELKSCSGKPQQQLDVSKTFIDFIVHRFNICGIEYNPQIRKIGIKDVSGIKSKYKNLTRNQDFQYDGNNFISMVCADTTEVQPFSIRLEKVLI